MWPLLLTVIMLLYTIWTIFCLFTSCFRISDFFFFWIMFHTWGSFPQVLVTWPLESFFEFFFFWLEVLVVMASFMSSSVFFSEKIYLLGWYHFSVYACLFCYKNEVIYAFKLIITSWCKLTILYILWFSNILVWIERSTTSHGLILLNAATCVFDNLQLFVGQM